MKIISTFLSVLFLTFLFNSTGNAQGTIAAWDFTGSSSPVTWPSSLFNANLVTAGSANNVTRGATAAASTGANSFRTLGFKNEGISTSNTDYFQVTLTAAAGYKLSLLTIDAKLHGTASFDASPGVTSQFAYSLNGTNFTLINSPQLVIGGPQSLAQINVSAIGALQSVAAGTTVTLRYYASGQTTTGGWGFYSASSGTYGLAIGGTVASDGSANFTLGGSLTTFSQTSASASAEQTYTIGGTNLINTVTVTPPSGFEISKTTGTGFVNSTSNLTFTAAQVMANPTIYVRLHAANPGSYSGSIAHASSDFTTVYQPVSGTYTAPCVLSLTAFLEGYTNAGGTAMNYAPSAVTVELHNSTTPYALVESQTGSLSTAGIGTFSFTTALNSTPYYIVVKTWNTLETWSASAQSFTSYALSYNFTTAAAQAYGNNLKQIGTKWCIYSGDVNQDGFVNLSDCNLINNDSYNLVNGYVVTDLTGDLYTNLSDLLIVNNNSYGLVSKNVPSIIQPSVFSITGTLGSFSQTSSTPSAEQTYNISGTSLTANVTVVPPAGFEISKTTGSGFVNSTSSLVYTAANVMAGQTIYVRLNAGSVGSYSGSITQTSANSEFTQATQSVAGVYSVLSGNVNLTMGNPSGATTDINFPHNYLLVKPQFCAGYDRDKGIPIWTSWQLNSTWCNGPAVRKDNYIADPSLPAAWNHIGGSDYSGSGFSRGHMCPSADRLVTQADNDSLFYMTNMVPQNQNQNAGIWEQLETYERTLANAGNVLYIISGGYGAGGTGTSGYATTADGGKVTVPALTWKVILVLPAGTNDVSRVTTSTRTIAVNMPNSDPPSGANWGTYRVSVASIESLTGFTFFSNVSSSINNVIKANVDTGPTN